VCSLLVYRKANAFCKLILYPAILLKIFMVFTSFRVEFVGSLTYRIMSSANRNTLTIPYLFVLLLFLLPAFKIAKAILNQSGESGHPCLIPEFRENGFCFSI
jgi:hypothetical protein